MVVVAAGALDGCIADDVPILARARLVEAREDLVGGPRALGEIGDFRLENDRIRLIVQGPSHSRMLGIFGGGLIDADLVRPRGEGDSSGGAGKDALGEIFPVFLLQGVNVQRVEIRADGSDGGPAQVAAVGSAGDFVELLGVLNRAVLGSHEGYLDPASEQRLGYEILYTLRPGAQHVELTLRVTNVSARQLTFPTPDAARLAELAGIDGTALPVPVGDVAVFSASSRAFVPGIGFDLRFGIEDASRVPRTLPALPGVAAPWIATHGDGASYGIVGAPSERNYAWQNRDQYGADGTEVSDSSVFIPFAAGGFVTIFHQVAPPILEPGESFEVTRYFVLGKGDVGSVLDGIHRLQGVATGRVGGQVLDALTGAPASDASVLVHRRRADGTRPIFSQYDVTEEGSFGGTLEPGDYSLRVTGPGRPMTGFSDFRIEAGRSTALELEALSAARLVVHARDSGGWPLPSRTTVVGVYGPERVGFEPRRFLYDLQAGEITRLQDMVPDDPDDPTTRRFIEASGPARDGAAELLVRPGRYDIFTSRGPEYDIAHDVVDLLPGRTTVLSHVLTRVVDTTGWIAADMHLHSRHSHDSDLGLDERVLTIAAEGIEWAVSTDHNYVTDYDPAIARTGLIDWMRSSIGLEVTTIESGHFNGYPLRRDLADVTRGAIAWSDRPPAEIFDRLRSLGRYGPEQTIVQVNHPRTPVLGYFSQYHRDTFTMEALPADLVDIFLAPTGPAFVGPGGETTFSLDFDAIEVVNGKQLREIHPYRIPDTLPPDAPPGLPPTGTIYTKTDGQAAYAGVVDDWYNLLNRGHRFIAVGTSDSHGDEREAGFFRTMVHVGADDPTALSDIDLVRGLRSRRVVATNGPVLDFWVDDPVRGIMGQTIATPRDVATVHVTMRTAPWVHVTRLNIVRNGAIATVVPVDPFRDYAVPFDIEVELPLARDAIGAPVDSWFVVEAVGLSSMFPIVTPFEVSPFQISEAVSTITGGLAFVSPLGSATPSENLPYTPYAITNPVWVTAGEHPFVPPGPLPAAEQISPANDAGILRGPRPLQSVLSPTSAPAAPALPPWLFGRDPGQRHDMGAIFRRMSHGHGGP